MKNKNNKNNIKYLLKFDWYFLCTVFFKITSFSMLFNGKSLPFILPFREKCALIFNPSA